MNNIEIGSNEIESKEISMKNLYLNPNNPRLHVRETQHINDRDIINGDIQENILQKMIQKEFDIPGLMDSIKSKGFIQIDSIFVRNIGKRNYVVLEGNRRITSIKELIKRHQGKKKKDILSPLLLKQIEKISCKILKNPTSDKIDYILGIRHQTGPMEWGPIQKANSIYKRYIIEYEKKNKKRLIESEFVFDPDVGKQVKDTFNISLPNVKKALRNYVVFHQMIRDNYDVDEKDYSFFEEGLNKKQLRESFFKQDPLNFTLLEDGREKFWKLCNFRSKSARDKSPINMAIKFREFSKIYEDSTERGSEKWVNRVLEDGEDPAEIWSKIDAGNQKSSWLDSLELAYKKLKSGFDIEEFEGSQSEMNFIDKIDNIINKLKSIAKDRKNN